MRTFGIGDIHGAPKALKQALQRSPSNPGIDKFIFLGDYVDGWSESAELIQYLIELKRMMGDRMILIRGNHDCWAHDYLHRGDAPMIWTQQGGQATIDSYIRTEYLVNEEHRKFFRDLKDWYIDEENRLFIHGGFDYKSGPFPESALYPVNAGTTAKECHWDRSLLACAKSGVHSQEMPKALRQFKEVYIGHTATSSHLPENYCNLWNIDSGCGWHGKLTIMDIDTKEYWQSDFVKDLYPDEKGR